MRPRANSRHCPRRAPVARKQAKTPKPLLHAPLMCPRQLHGALLQAALLLLALPRSQELVASKCPCLVDSPIFGSVASHLWRRSRLSGTRASYARGSLENAPGDAQAMPMCNIPSLRGFPVIDLRTTSFRRCIEVSRRHYCTEWIDLGSPRYSGLSPKVRMPLPAMCRAPSELDCCKGPQQVGWHGWYPPGAIQTSLHGAQEQSPGRPQLVLSALQPASSMAWTTSMLSVTQLIQPT